jgi:hypothetical protein
MANIEEQVVWEEGITRIETTTPWVGDEEGTCNMQTKVLANRTQYLKQVADDVEEARGRVKNECIKK